MIISKSKKISEITKITRNHGMNRTLKQRYTLGYPWDYDIKKQGYNYRMDEIRAVLGLNQLKRIRKINSERQKSFKYYCQQLSKINGINVPDTNDLNDNACHLFRISIDETEFGMNRNQVFTKLSEKNITTSVHYKPLSLFTIFKKKSKSYSSLENSLKVYDETLSLPFYTGISKNNQNIVIDALKSLKN